MNLTFLSKTILFRGTAPEDLSSMLTCLGARERSYEKGETILCAGDLVSSMGLILSGSVLIENNDRWGNKSIINHLSAGQIFGETYACIPGEPMMVDVIADEPAQILFLNVGRLLRTCPSACAHHSRLIRNLLMVTAQKNLNLSQRILHTSSKSIRGRLLSYLSFQADRQGSPDFTIPFNRQQLADYLSVDRSALSNELGKMQREGLLTVSKNHFILSENSRE